MIISRIALIGEPGYTVQMPETATPGSPGLVVVSGPNGSGKSLLTLALEACFAPESVRVELAEAISSAGVERIELDFEHQHWQGHLTFTLADGARAIEWGSHSPGLSDGENPPADFEWNELFTAVHRVRSGHVIVEGPGSIERAAVQMRRAPLKGDLERWLGIERDLAGEDGEGGRLGRVREQWQATTAERERVELLARDLEAARARHEDLRIRIHDAASQRDILSAEADELAKACGLAERATRLDLWISEIRQESKTVQRLREQHAELQERLDELELRFRGMPEDFPSLLEDYESLLTREKDLRDRTADARSNTERLKSELTELEGTLDQLSAPEVEDLVVRRDRMGREIETANLQITELLRGRIDLVRQRDELEQHMHRKYQPFLDLESDARKSLEEFFLQTAVARPESAPTEPASARHPEPYEARAATIQTKLRERFQGFELLTPSASEMLRELFDQRHAFGTLSSDLEGLKSRAAQLRGMKRQARGVGWSIAAGAAGFALGTAALSWDVGLFAGLAASLITLLAFQYSYRRIESEIESAMSAEAMTQRRYDTVRESMSRLERALKPVTHIPILEEALARMEEYKSLIRELKDVETELAAIRTAEPVQAVPEEPDPALTALLPESLIHMPLPLLQELHGEFVALEAQAADLNSEWNRFAEGGTHAEQIRNLEDTIARLHEEQSQLAAEIEHRNQSYLLQHNDLLSRRGALEDALNAAERALGLDSELTDIREDLIGLDKEVGGLLKNADIEGLRVEWRERETLRARLRETRDALSARQTHDELRAREALLSEELAQVKHRLLDVDPLYLLQGTASDYASKYAGQLQRLRRDSVAAEEEMRRLQSDAAELDLDSKAAAFAAARPADELREAEADVRERFDAVERELGGVRARIGDVQKRLDGIAESVAHDLAETINRQVREFTEDRLQGVAFSDGQWFAKTADGTLRPMRNLSEGTCDLIYLAIRVAVLEYLQDLEAGPVVWDEALSRLDERHLTQVRIALVRLSSRRQVMLLTRHTAFEWWGPSVRLSAPASSVFAL
ncbi:MAG TPA: hypothetical protein VGL38_11070 [bacterium]